MLEHISKMWVRVQEAHCYSVTRYSSVLLSDQSSREGRTWLCHSRRGVDFTIWIRDAKRRKNGDL